MRAASWAASSVELPLETRRLAGTVHVALTGPAGSDWTIHLADGKVRVSAGAPRPPTSVVTLPNDAMLELLAGRGDLFTAQMTGRVRVQGDPLGPMLLGAVVSGFRKSLSAPGVRGAGTRSIERWCERGTRSTR
jgi:hypothetical protein